MIVVCVVLRLEEAESLRDHTRKAGKQLRYDDDDESSPRTNFVEAHNFNEMQF